MATNDPSILQRLQRAKEPRAKKIPQPIAKVSEKKKQEDKVAKELMAADKAFYVEVWLASPHKCQNCDINLPKTPSNWMFHHLLEKRNYPQFRYTPENIMILCLECHSKAETNIDFTPRIKNRRDEVIKQLLG